jgi:hypothetical protein
MSIRYRVGSDHMMIMIKIKGEFDSDICTDKKKWVETSLLC